MKRYLKIAIVLLFMVFILTGCTNTEYNVKVKRDGSGEVSYTIEFDENVLNEKVNEGNENGEKINGIAWAQDYNFLGSTMEAAQKNGYETQEINKDGGILGFSAYKKFNNLADEFKIEDSVGDEYITINDDDGMKVEKGFFITTYTRKFYS